MKTQSCQKKLENASQKSTKLCWKKWRRRSREKKLHFKSSPSKCHLALAGLWLTRTKFRGRGGINWVLRYPDMIFVSGVRLEGQWSAFERLFNWAWLWRIAYTYFPIVSFKQIPCLGWRVGVKVIMLWSNAYYWCVDIRFKGPEQNSAWLKKGNVIGHCKNI